MILQRRQAQKMDEIHAFSEVTVTVSDCVDLSRILVGVPKEAVGTVFLLSRLLFYGFFHWYSSNEEEDPLGIKKKWKDPKIIFTIEDLIQSSIKVTSLFDGFGLLKATHIHQLPANTTTYNFAHLTIQEFLCSCYVSLLSHQRTGILNEETF